MEHTFSVLAAIIKRNPAFLEALNQLVAQFMPPPQVDSSPPEQAWQQDPWQQRKSRRRSAGSRETEQSTSHGTQSPAASRSVEEPHHQEWPLPGATPRKRRRSPLAARDAEESTPISTTPQTVVLRSIGKKEVSAFTGQEIREAVKQAGIDNMEGYTVHQNEKANAIAITTRDPLMVEKLLQVREIRKGEETLPLQPYKALAGNQCRGVIYLPGEGNTVTPESLPEDIDCRSHKVAAARPIGAKGNTILVTFEGRVLPKKVRYMCEVLDVHEYRPRPLVCFRCHGIGHKMDVCPRGSARCGTCGSEHDGMEGCAQAPKCVNCGGAHLATSNERPKRAIPPRRNDNRKTSGPEQGPGGSFFSSTKCPSAAHRSVGQTLSPSVGYYMDHFSEAVDEPLLENIKQAVDPENSPLYDDGLPAQEDLAVVQPHPALFEQVEDEEGAVGRRALMPVKVRAVESSSAGDQLAKQRQLASKKCATTCANSFKA
ncbi:hypothetical protein HPB47_013324 [Ixodes persulcatus]|uniref:Uncharacterized protein n=1 Tax=Ixodes persulcatus TaxID=34615 RepID=A0AC60QZQ6_IXOPE|nr:hypothetical protein HPB47_013324 [Ixodes persulcatus]